MAPRPSGRVTSRDIARAAGVSQPTVSRALRGDPRVAPATTALVRETARRLGYVPDAAARTLITRRTGTVAVVVADIGNPFYTELVSALHGNLGRAGYRTVLINERTDLRGDAGVQPLLRSGLVDGALVATATLDEQTRVLLRGERTPIVLVNRELDEVERDTVVSHNRMGGAAAARLLVELGHRRIGHVAGPPNTSTARDRAAGFAETLEGLGVPLDPRYRRTGDFSHRDGHRWALELLALDRPPSAIFCDNDVIALGALDAARARGVRVPDDLSIVGFDNISLAGWESFRLTTIHQPLSDMAEEAVRLLVDRIAHPDQPVRRVVFPTEVIQRGTTARLSSPS